MPAAETSRGPARSEETRLRAGPFLMVSDHTQHSPWPCYPSESTRIALASSFAKVGWNPLCCRSPLGFLMQGNGAGKTRPLPSEGEHAAGRARQSWVRNQSRQDEGCPGPCVTRGDLQDVEEGSPPAEGNSLRDERGSQRKCWETASQRWEYSRDTGNRGQWLLSHSYRRR